MNVAAHVLLFSLSLFSASSVVQLRGSYGSDLQHTLEELADKRTYLAKQSKKLNSLLETEDKLLSAVEQESAELIDEEYELMQGDEFEEVVVPSREKYITKHVIDEVSNEMEFGEEIEVNRIGLDIENGSEEEKHMLESLHEAYEDEIRVEEEIANANLNEIDLDAENGLGEEKELLESLHEAYKDEIRVEEEITNANMEIKNSELNINETELEDNIDLDAENDLGKGKNSIEKQENLMEKAVEILNELKTDVEANTMLNKNEMYFDTVNKMVNLANVASDELSAITHQEAAVIQEEISVNKQKQLLNQISMKLSELEDEENLTPDFDGKKDYVESIHEMDFALHGALEALQTLQDNPDESKMEEDSSS